MPSHSFSANIKHMSESHTFITFCVEIYPFLPISSGCSVEATTQWIWVPSIAHMALLKNGQYRRSFQNFGWISWKLGYCSLMYSKDKLRQASKTLWKCLHIVSPECWNLSYIILLPSAWPNILKNTTTISSTPIRLVPFKQYLTNSVQNW